MKTLKSYGLYLLGAFLWFSPTVHASEAECIKLAAYPDEGVGGVKDDKFDAVNALLACKPAADAAPDNAQLNMLTARAFMGLNKGNEALPYLGKAANKGSWRAQFTFYDWATRKPPILRQTDQVKMQLLTAAAKSGPPRMALLLALNYAQGRFTPKNIPNAVKLSKALAEKGYAPGMRVYGQLISAGIKGVDKADALVWLEKAAKAGDAEAMYSYGGSLLSTDDYRKGLDWLNKAADLNFLPAQQLVLGTLEKGNDRLKPNKRQAERTLKKWADKDFLFGLTQLGKREARQGLKNGSQYLTRAFEAGHIESGWSLVNHYKRKKDSINTQKWLDRIWDTGELSHKNRVLDFYDKGKDLAGFSRAFSRFEAEAVKEDPIEGYYTAVNTLNRRYHLTGMKKYWKAAKRNIELYLQKGGEKAEIRVAGLLLPKAATQRNFYESAEQKGRDYTKQGQNFSYNRHHGPTFKAMYEILLDIFLNEKWDDQNKQAVRLRETFSKSRKRYSAAVEIAMKLHNQGLRKVAESNNLANFLRRGYAPDCGTMPRLPSDNASGETVKNSNKRVTKWRNCVDAKAVEASRRMKALSAWQGYRETNMGFGKDTLWRRHTKKVGEFKDKINADRRKLEDAIVARNERIAKK